MVLLLTLVLQFLPGLPDPDAIVEVGGVVEGPFIFREDQGQTSKVVLTNGLTAIVRESNASGVTSLTLEARAGYLDEPVRSGLSRIVAQSLVESVRSPDTFALHPVHRIGGDISVDVEARRTVFQVTVAPERIAEALEWQSGVLDSPEFSSSRTETAIGHLAAGQSVEMDRPSVFVTDRVLDVAYGDHPSGRGRWFDRARAGEIASPEFDEFFDTWYAPSNLVVVVVGPFVREEMLGEIVRTFGALSGPEMFDDSLADSPNVPSDDGSPAESAAEDIEAGLVGAVDEGGLGEDVPGEELLGDDVAAGAGDDSGGEAAQVPVPDGFRYDWQRSGLGRAHFGIAFRVPEASVAGTRERYVLETLLALLADGRASRLNTFVRDEQAAIDRAEASFLELGTSREPELVVLLHVAALNINVAEIAVFTELERIRRFGVNDEEVARARVRAAQRHYEDRQTAGGVAADLARREFHGDWKAGERYPAGIAAVTAVEVQAFVQENLRRDNLAVFELLPSGSTRALSSEAFVSTVLEQVPVQMVSRAVEQLPVTAVVPIREDVLVMDVSHPMNRFPIRRGPDVFIVEDHRSPLVSFGIFFPGGRILEGSDNAGITELMLQSALRGTRRFNAPEIARRIENAGARVEVVNESDYFGYVLDGVSGDLEAALDVLMDIWQEPSFLEDDVDAARRLHLGRMLDDVEQAPQRALHRLFATAFAGDPYSIPRIGTPETLAAIDSEALEAWHLEHARAVMPVIVIAGDVNGSGIVSSIATTITNEDLFERDVSSLPDPVRDDEFPEFGPEEGAAYGLVAHGGSVAGFPSPDRFRFGVVSAFLGGHQGTMGQAFAERNIAATVDVSTSFMARAGLVYTVVGFVPEESVDVDAVLDVVTSEFQRIAVDGLDRESLNSAMTRADVLHRVEIDGVRRRVDAVARTLLLGGGPEGVDAFGDVVRSLESEQIQEAARRLAAGPNLHTIEIRP